MEQPLLPGFEVTDDELVNLWFGGKRLAGNSRPVIHQIYVSVVALEFRRFEYTLKLWDGISLWQYTQEVTGPATWRHQVVRGLEARYQARLLVGAK